VSRNAKRLNKEKMTREFSLLKSFTAFIALHVVDAKRLETYKELRIISIIKWGGKCDESIRGISRNVYMIEFRRFSKHFEGNIALRFRYIKFRLSVYGIDLR
jgi:hypothetical protein